MEQQVARHSEEKRELMSTVKEDAVSKNGLFEPFLYKNEHFAKTGSGQTQGKLPKDAVFRRTVVREHPGAVRPSSLALHRVARLRSLRSPVVCCKDLCRDVCRYDSYTLLTFPPPLLLLISALDHAYTIGISICVSVRLCVFVSVRLSQRGVVYPCLRTLVRGDGSAAAGWRRDSRRSFDGCDACHRVGTASSTHR